METTSHETLIPDQEPEERPNGAIRLVAIESPGTAVDATMIAVVCAIWTAPDGQEKWARAAWLSAGASCSKQQPPQQYLCPSHATTPQAAASTPFPAHEWGEIGGFGRLLSRFSPTHQVQGNAVVVTDSLMEYLPYFRELRMLNLGRPEWGNDTSQVTSGGWRQLGQLEHLETLVLAGSSIKDSDLVAVARLDQLRWLDLSHTLITDTGLAHLSRLTKLETLCLKGTATTSTGLRHLHRLSSLRDLRLGNAASRGISSSAIDALRKAIPECWPTGSFTSDPGGGSEFHSRLSVPRRRKRRSNSG